MPVTPIDDISSARDFWTKIALPDYEEFRADPINLGKAFHAAMSLYHVVDWVWGDYKSDPQRVFHAKSLENLRDYIVKQECEDFGLIRDVADSSKHFRLDRKTATVASATQVVTRSTGWGEGRYGEGPYGGTPQVVIERSTDVRHFSAIAKNVCEMWERLFRQQGW